jgi:hypothetical protein
MHYGSLLTLCVTQWCTTGLFSHCMLHSGSLRVYSHIVCYTVVHYGSGLTFTVCPTRYRTRNFFNNFTTNEDIATKIEADLFHCVRNVKEKNVLLFKCGCNVFIGVRIIKEMPGSVASGTFCICVFKKYSVNR